MRSVRLLAMLLVLAITTGCGLFGKSTEPEAAPPGSKLELKSMTVLLCCGAMDVVPFYYAQDQGYFKNEGLDITVQTADNGGQAVEKVISGEVQIAFSSYTPIFAAQAKGVADLRLVADATQLAPGNTVLVTKRDAPPLTSITELTGRRVAITAPNTMTQFLVQSAAEVNGVDPKSVKMVPMGFPDMEPALARGNIDVALLTEPYLTRALMAKGVTEIYDTSKGPTQDMPIGGYSALKKFVDEKPNTVAAFQRILAKATDEIVAKPELTDPVIMKYGKISKEEAPLIKRTTYQKSLDPVRLQRVADLMQRYGALPNKLDVSAMITKPAA